MLLADHGPPILLADGGLGMAIMATLAIGLSVASYFMAKSHKGPRTTKDFTPTTLSMQGSWIPLLIGRRRIGCVLAWSGFRFTHSESSGGGGGGGLFGKGGFVDFLFGKGAKKKSASASKQTIYFESGWHQLCVGPAQALYTIWQDGKVLWSGYIHRDTDPSGSTFVANDGSEFRIYWGEPDQDVDPTLSSGTGIPSRWPHLCYIVWIGKRLGTSPRWPQIEYDLETLVYTNRFDTVYPGMAETLDPRINVDPYPDTDLYGGPNPGWILGQLMFETWPQGIGLPFEHFSIGDSEIGEGGPEITSGSFTDMVEACETEQLVLSCIAADGEEASATIAKVMQEMGVLWVRDYEDTYNVADYGLNSWKLIRASGVNATIPTEAVFPTEPESEVNHAEVGADRLIFAFQDLDRNYKDSTLTIDEDGQALLVNNIRARKIEMPCVIHPRVAARVSQRRSQEEISNLAKFSVFAGRSSRSLMPGIVVAVPGIEVGLRLTEVMIDADSDKVELTLLQDHYGALASSYRAPPNTVFYPDTGDPTDNVMADFWEVPGLIGQPGQMNVLPLRVRGDTRMSQQVIHISVDASTYREVNRDRTIQVGGLLTEALAVNDAWVMEDGPALDVSGLFPNADAILDVAVDYTADEAAWKLGRQMCLIDEELFFLRNVEALGGNSYRLHGLVRARGDTERAAHAIGAKVYIFQFDDTEPFFDLFLSPGRTLYMKQQAAGGGPGAVPLGSVTVQNKVLVGKGIVPMRPGALRVTAPRLCVNEFSTGQDVSLAWTYRSLAVPGTGAGLWNFGDAVGRSPVEGSFELQFLDMANVVKFTVDASVLLQDLDYTATNADLVTWFAGEPAQFKVRLRNVNGGFRSPYLERTITLV